MNTLHYILKPVSIEIELVERNLRDQLSRIAEGHTVTNPYSRLGDRAIGHLFKTHGKRLRPALFLLSAKASRASIADRSTALVQIATSLELIHSASLIHDDVIDEAVFRRARVSVNERYGNKIAVLAGDILYTQFYSIVSSLNELSLEMRMKLLELFTDVTRKMCFGEIYEERMRTQRKAPEFSDYLDTIENKTASLMSACCEAGSLVAGADADTTDALKTYGYHLGMAYQLLDDLDDHDSVFPDSELISREATRHVNESVETLMRIPQNPSSDRLRAIVETVSGTRQADASSRSA